MSRTELSEQRHYEYQFTIKVQPRDVNFAGHAACDSLVAMAGTARSNTLGALGFNEGDLGDGKTGVIMSDLEVNYRAGAFMFDELVFDNHVGEISRTGFRLFQRVRKEAAVIALIETGFATFNYEKRKIAPVPEAFVKAVNAYDNGLTAAPSG